MSDERETPTAETPAESNPVAGAPVEEAAPTDTEVLAALDRAGELPAEPALAGSAPEAIVDEAVIAMVATESVVAETPTGDAVVTETVVAETLVTEAESPAVRPEIVLPDELPSAGPLAPAVAPAGGLLISADHPMAALYMQTPMPPEIRGNRGAGILIALLATLAFALLYAGALALWIAPSFPPSTFLAEGLLPLVLSWGFLVTVAVFFVALVVLVLILGRAGWWAYVIFGVFVAAVVWAGATVGAGVTAAFGLGEAVRWNPLLLLQEYGLTIPVIAAAVLAREVTVWFGAWIGARGRKVTRRNAEAIVEYEAALAEAQANQP